MKVSTQQNLNKLILSSIGFLILLLLIKWIITLTTVFIYAKFSPFPDAERYLSAPLTTWDSSLLFDRTLFTDFIYSLLKFCLKNNVLVHLFVSTMLTILLWHVIKAEYSFINKPLLLACVCLPHFLIWTGIVGKEAIAIAGFLLIIKVCIDLTVWNHFRIVSLIVGLFLALIERPHYGIVYFYLLAISFMSVKFKLKLMGFFSTKQSFILLVSILAYLIISLHYLSPLYEGKLLQFMIRCKLYFFDSMDSTTNRWDISWAKPSDFFINLGWGIPQSIIGPTWVEALNRTILFPVFIEGCAAFLLVIINCYLLVNGIKKYPQYRTIILWGFIPAGVLGLLINYPFCIFNPGSAIRYKQSLVPLFYFYPLLLLGAIKRKYSAIKTSEATPISRILQ